MDMMNSLRSLVGRESSGSYSMKSPEDALRRFVFVTFERKQSAQRNGLRKKRRTRDGLRSRISHPSRRPVLEVLAN